MCEREWVSKGHATELLLETSLLFYLCDNPIDQREMSTVSLLSSWTAAIWDIGHWPFTAWPKNPERCSETGEVREKDTESGKE